MADLPESSNFDAGVYQIETTDPVLGGPGGIANVPLQNLANRTRWLKDRVDDADGLMAAAVEAATTQAGIATAAADNAQSSARTVALWDTLATYTPAVIGEGAEVLDSDAGTHTDPQTSATVANAGRYTAYATTVGAWTRIGDTGLAGKASTADLTAETASRIAGDEAVLAATPRTATRRRSTGRFFRWSLISPLGKVFAGLSHAGIFHALGIKIFAQTGRHRSTRASLFSISDAAGKRLLAIFEDGKTWLRLNSDVVQQISDELSIVSTPALRGASDATDLRASADVVRGRVAVSKWAGDVKQPRAGTALISVPDVPEPMPAVFLYGQSNAGGGGIGTGQFPSALPLYAHHAFQFSTGDQKYGNSAVSTGQLFDLGVADEPDARPWLSTCTAIAYAELCWQRNRVAPGMFVRTDWYGGEPLNTFKNGTAPAYGSGNAVYGNLQASLTFAKTVVGNYGRAIDPYVVWEQGESGVGGGLAETRANYGTELDGLINSVNSDSLTANGFEPSWIIWQICHENAVTRGATLGARDVGLLHRRGKIVVAGPTYPLPFIGTNSEGTDTIHHDYIGRMMQAEVTALAIESMRSTGTFTPVQPRRITRTGATIVIDFDNPGQPLAFDDDWVPAIANYGFSYSDDTSSASVSSVQITGLDQITVTLSSAPTGANGKIGYGIAPQSAPTNQWTQYRGQLYASSGIASIYSRLGYAVPSDIRFYCLAFEESV